MKFRSLYLFLLFAFVFLGCDGPTIFGTRRGHYHITVVNTSDKKLLVNWADTTSDSIYHVTLLACKYYKAETYIFLEPHSTGKPLYSGISHFEDLFKEYTYISILFIDFKKALTTNLDKEEDVLKTLCGRYEMSIDDMKMLNWTIPYPPTEEMRGITMDPDFDTIVEWSKN